MKINLETFEHIISKRGITQKYLAEKALLGEKTIGRIKKGLSLRQNTIEQIAEALKCSKENLMGPLDTLLAEEPNRERSKKAGLGRLVADIEKSTIRDLEIASVKYNVPTEIILNYAPLLFSLVAEISLTKRRKAVKTWQDLANNMPAMDLLDYGSLDDEYSSIEESELEGRSPSDEYTSAYELNEENAESEEEKELWRESGKNAFLETIHELSKDALHRIDFYFSSIESIDYDNYPLDDFADLWLIDKKTEKQTKYSEMAMAVDIKNSNASSTLILRDLPRKLLPDSKIEERVRYVASHYGGADGNLEEAIRNWDSDQKNLDKEKGQEDA